MTEHDKYPQMTVHINFLFCFLLHFKDGVNEVIILDGCMLFIKRPTMMCLADLEKKPKLVTTHNVSLRIREDLGPSHQTSPVADRGAGPLGSKVSDTLSSFKSSTKSRVFKLSY